MSEDGRRVVTGSSDGTLYVWDAFTGEELRSLGGHDDFIRHAVLNSRGTVVLSMPLDDSIMQFWDAQSGLLSATFPVGSRDGVGALPVLSPSGERVLTMDPGGVHVRAFTLETKDVLERMWSASRICPNANERVAITGSEPIAAELETRRCQAMVDCVHARLGDHEHFLGCLAEFRRAQRDRDEFTHPPG